MELSKLLSMLSVCNTTFSSTPSEAAANASTAFELFNSSLAEVCSMLLGPQQQDSHMSPRAQLVLMVAYGAMITAGLVCNAAVIMVVVRRSQIQTPRNLFIVNLTVSDITLCLVCMPFTLISLIHNKWVLGETLCKLVPALQGANIMVSTGTIAAIALDRYITIVRHSPCNSGAGGSSDNPEKTRVVISILLVWLLAVVAVLPLLYYQRVETLAVDNLVLYEVCIERWPSVNAKLGYTFFILLIMYVIPILVVAVVHARIASFLRTHTANVHSVAAAAAAGGGPAADANSAANRRAQREINRNKRTTTLLSVVAALFAVSWLPHYVLAVVVDAKPLLISTENLYIATAVCHLIAMSSAISNPIVYGWLNNNIRRELMTVLPPCVLRCCRKNQYDQVESDARFTNTIQVDMEMRRLSEKNGATRSQRSRATRSRRAAAACTTRSPPAPPPASGAPTPPPAAAAPTAARRPPRRSSWCPPPPPPLSNRPQPPPPSSSPNCKSLRACEKSERNFFMELHGDSMRAQMVVCSLFAWKAIDYFEIVHLFCGKNSFEIIICMNCRNIVSCPKNFPCSVLRMLTSFEKRNILKTALPTMECK